MHKTCFLRSEVSDHQYIISLSAGPSKQFKEFPLRYSVIEYIDIDIEE